jgi:hypothetical protein
MNPSMSVHVSLMIKLFKTNGQKYPYSVESSFGLPYLRQSPSPPLTSPATGFLTGSDRKLTFGRRGFESSGQNTLSAGVGLRDSAGCEIQPRYPTLGQISVSGQISLRDSAKSHARPDLISGLILGRTGCR